ncbi:hypothetical protein POPTR_013G068601v4 [Populus trichocarpa]|uniref:Uncharacterized protein n=1 Tax=Populus trichocarpa TaxID=3694 RepID=A0A3N7FX59_POPTR|nr:hypothetical protein POPTR_013G068601v4 [Populus trichocarpa]
MRQGAKYSSSTTGQSNKSASKNYLKMPATCPSSCCVWSLNTSSSSSYRHILSVCPNPLASNNNLGY